jgi:hypothetical protein
VADASKKTCSLTIDECSSPSPWQFHIADYCGD